MFEIFKECLKYFKIYYTFCKVIKISRMDDLFAQIIKPCHGIQTNFSVVTSPARTKERFPKQKICTDKQPRPQLALKIDNKRKSNFR